MTRWPPRSVEGALAAAEHQHLVALRRVLQRLEQAHDAIIVALTKASSMISGAGVAAVGEQLAEGEADQQAELLLRAAAEAGEVLAAAAALSASGARSSPRTRRACGKMSCR